jgi:integrase
VLWYKFFVPHTGDIFEYCGTKGALLKRSVPTQRCHAGEVSPSLRPPGQEAPRRSDTVADLIEEYIEKHAKKFKRSWENDQRMLKHDVLPAWGNLKAADIKKRDVALLLEKIVERGSPIMANNTFAVVRKMFNFAVERDILEHTPCFKVKPPAPKVERNRALSEPEIRTFWANLDGCAMSDGIRSALKLILVTAQRPGEVIGMHTRELDLVDGWWTIPAGPKTVWCTGFT